MKAALHALLFSAVAAISGGCVVYEPVPVATPVTLQQRFDRSWQAASGAMSDQGLSIDAQNRAAGIIRGSRSGIAITATVQTLADGSIQVRFDQTGATATDPDLVHRVSASYDRRMGR
jgi:hypothetical protein